MIPFLKWPGGKRWAAARIAACVREYLRGKYYEPFLGGGAVFFELCPGRAVLSDVNRELIIAYQQVRRSPRELSRAVRRLTVSEIEYRRIRDSSPRSPLQAAARFLYLNRTGFGGMYRLNKKGEFNVPYGGGERTPAVLWERDLLCRASVALRRAKVLHADFEDALLSAQRGDVVYCDPTYTIAHDNNGFRRYNESVFSWSDQERLRNFAFRAARRGATVLVSNARHRNIAELYQSPMCIEFQQLSRMSCVAANPKHRRLVHEYLFVIRKK